MCAKVVCVMISVVRTCMYVHLPLLKNEGNPALRVSYDSRPEQRSFSQRAFSTQCFNNVEFFLWRNFSFI